MSSWLERERITTPTRMAATAAIFKPTDAAGRPALAPREGIWLKWGEISMDRAKNSHPCGTQLGDDIAPVLPKRTGA